ncbi:unnamed protein product [Mesocestoides corti]|uniref:Polyketide cyclase / dehydrase and lipid transport n=1 Tax=Mesocestoides corti TaxID=53468 RepID=A0A0R3UJ94_MESCO|nr:unnamed protein product [Mesocestoides corti]
MNFWFPAVVILASAVAYFCVTPGPQIFELDIVLNQQAMRCFRFVTDFKRYPSWLDSVKSVTSEVDPASAVVGTEFELLFSKNFVENNKIGAEVLEIVEGMRFSFGLKDLMQTSINFTVKSLPKGSCKITVSMNSRKDNFFSNNLVIPTIRMSFYNWMLKSLLKLKASAH